MRKRMFRRRDYLALRNVETRSQRTEGLRDPSTSHERGLGQDTAEVMQLPLYDEDQLPNTLRVNEYS
jgi:hypothetical protein